MQNLPNAKTYEDEFEYTPWGDLIQAILGELCLRLPYEAEVLDLMCGTGFLLGRLHKKRPDLKLIGVDIGRGFISWARTHYKGVEFIRSDACDWCAERKFNAVICIGGVHHLPLKEQGPFLAKMAALLIDPSETKPNKPPFAIVADPYLRDFNDEDERLLSAAELGHACIADSIKKGAPRAVLKALVDVMSNDLFQVEWKMSARERLEQLSACFSDVALIQQWPRYHHASEAKRLDPNRLPYLRECKSYGDYGFILKK